jgi:antitoxin (DNA-binding transcriptional repressor) of toxin-antitoxin stability system
MKSSQPPLQISIRELHARTGHYVRKAATHRVVITSHGKPSAELSALKPEDNDVPYFARRKLLPGYKKALEAGAYTMKPGDRDSTDLISEDREDRV